MLGPKNFGINKRLSAGLTGRLDSMSKNFFTPPVPSPQLVYSAASPQLKGDARRADTNKALKYDRPDAGEGIRETGNTQKLGRGKTSRRLSEWG
jgi:hypothetical protein